MEPRRLLGGVRPCPYANLCRAVKLRTGLSASEVGAPCAVVRAVTGLAENSSLKLDWEEGHSSVLGLDEAERMPGRVQIDPEHRRI